MKMKNMTAFLLAMALLVSMLGCSGGGSEPAASSTTPAAAPSAADPDAPAEPVTLHYVNLTDRGVSLLDDQLYNKIDAFNASNGKGITVETEYISTEQYWTKIAALSAANSMPDVMFMSPNRRCYDYAAAGSILPLNSYLDADPAWRDSFVNGAFSSVTLDGQTYAIPLWKGSGCVFYNKEMFEQAGIAELPKTWAEFLDVCQKLKDSGVQPLALAAQDPDTWCVALLTAYLAQRIGGTEPIEAIGSRADGYTFQQDCFIQAGQMTRELIDNGYIPESCSTTSRGQADAEVTSGQAAMIVHLSSLIATLEAGDSQVAGKMGAFPFPTVDGGAGGKMWMSKYNTLAIGAQTKSPEACVELIKALTDQEISKAFAEIAGGIPAVSVEVDMGKCPPELSDVITALETSEGDFPYFDEFLGTTIGNEWNSTLGAICAGVKTPEKAFEDLQLFTELNS